MKADYATGLSQVTILMLDDDPTMRAAVRSMMRAAGVKEMIQTGDGQDALDIIAQRHVDLVLCDCNMSPMDGLTFLKRLRATPEGTNMPVIMLTASESGEEAWRAREMKVSAWLVKPVVPQVLADQVAATLGMAPTRVREDSLAALAEAYEAKLPAEVEGLQTMAAALTGSGEQFGPLCHDLMRRLHNLKGQAGTLGYPLLGAVGGRVHDLLRETERDLEATAPLHPDVIKLATVAVAAMKLIVERKLRGEGGNVGVKLLQQIDAFGTPLHERLAQAMNDAASEARDRREANAQRAADAAANRWLLQRRINLDEATEDRAR